MNVFLKLIKIKWIFKKLNKKDILIYDRMTEERGFARILFSKKSYQILDCRYESINIYVLCLTLLRFGVNNLKDNYKKMFIMLVSPKIVYTAIDNNPAFFKLKNIYDKPRYIHLSKIGKPKIKEIEDLNLLNETILHLM